MSNDAIRYQILGMLSEEGEEYVEIAKNTEDHLLKYIKDYIQDDDDNVHAAKLCGLSLASTKFEDLA